MLPRVAKRLMRVMTSPANEARERREVHYAGHVQGVGFRYTTRSIAGRFDVQGFVQNLHDGRVLLTVEGRPAILDGFLAALDAEMSRYLRHKDSTTGPATDEFTGFEIRH